MKLRLGHHENLPTLLLEPSAPRASNLACFKDKRLSSLSQLQMVIAAVVLRGRTPKPSRQININLAEGNEVGHSIHCSGRVFCNVCLCDCKALTTPAHSSRSGSERFTVAWQSGGGTRIRSPSNWYTVFHLRPLNSCTVSVNSLGAHIRHALLMSKGIGLGAVIGILGKSM